MWISNNVKRGEENIMKILGRKKKKKLGNSFSEAIDYIQISMV